MKKTKKPLKAAQRARLPKRDAAAEKKFHSFLDLWNAHIREQIRIHQLILRGKESLKAHVKHTERAHKKFLSQLKKI